jgi:hypothetical protein
MILILFEINDEKSNQIGVYLLQFTTKDIFMMYYQIGLNRL